MNKSIEKLKAELLTCQSVTLGMGSVNRIVNYNTPNEVINYYTLDKEDNKIEK